MRSLAEFVVPPSGGAGCGFRLKAELPTRAKARVPVVKTSPGPGKEI